jgi:hypothetical protein
MTAQQFELAEDVFELLALDGELLPVVLFNGPVVTTTGLYRVRELDVEEAQRLVRLYGWVSAVGHEAAAAVFSRVLGLEVPMNRVQYRQRVGQLAIALKLRARPPEGQVLSVEEMLQIGFSLLLMERLE